MKKQLFSIFLFLLFIPISKADQCAILDHKMAEAAVKYFKENTDVVLWCACCDNDKKVYLKVTDVYFKEEETDWCELVLKGVNELGKKITTTVDLAYTHVVREGKAYCSGKELECGCKPCTEPFAFKIPVIPEIKVPQWNFGEFQTGNQPQAFSGYSALKFPSNKEPEKRMKLGDCWASAIGFSRDSEYLVAGGGNFDRFGIVKVFRVKNGEVAFELKGHTQAVRSLAVSPTSDIAVSSDDTGLIIAWNYVTGTKLYEVKEHSGNWVEKVCFSRDGKYFASAGRDNKACVFDAADGKLLRKFEVDFGIATSVEFSPDNRILAVGGKAPEDMFKMFDLVTGEEITSLKPHTEWCKDIAFSPDGTIIALAGECDYAIVLAEGKTGEKIVDFPAAHGCVESVNWDPSGKYLAMASLWGIQVIDSLTGEIVFDAKSHAYPVEDICFSPDAKWLATAGRDGEIHFWMLKAE